MFKAVLSTSLLLAGSAWAQHDGISLQTEGETASDEGNAPAEGETPPAEEATEGEPTPTAEKAPEAAPVGEEAPSEAADKTEGDSADETSSEASEEKPAEAEDAPAAEAPAPEPVVEAKPQVAPPVDPKLEGLTLGAQVVFAAALQSEAIAGEGSYKDRAEAGRLAGSFSVTNGDWLDPSAAADDQLKAFAETVAPLSDVDPQDGAAIKGKSKEILAAIKAAKALAESGARPVLRAEVLSSLATFELAMNPPYAHGLSHRRIYGWTAIGAGGLVALTGGTALINPNEPDRVSFAAAATTVGILLAGAGAAMVLLDDSP